jgi:hypothetical protein
MIALHCNGQQYAVAAPAPANVWIYSADGYWTTINLDRIADAVWEGDEI